MGALLPYGDALGVVPGKFSLSTNTFCRRVTDTFIRVLRFFTLFYILLARNLRNLTLNGHRWEWCVSGNEAIMRSDGLLLRRERMS